MKKLSILVLPLVLALSAMVILGGVSSSVIAQQNQTSAQGNQTSSQNQTSASQSPKSSQSQDEKLLTLTTSAIAAFNKGDKKNVTASLKTLQDTLINATGKQLVVVPAEKTTGKSSHTGGKSSGSSDKSSKSGG